MARYRAAGLSLPLARDLAGAAEERVRDGMQRGEAEPMTPREPVASGGEPALTRESASRPTPGTSPSPPG